MLLCPGFKRGEDDIGRHCVVFIVMPVRPEVDLFYMPAGSIKSTENVRSPPIADTEGAAVNYNQYLVLASRYHILRTVGDNWGTRFSLLQLNR
jgi:hypothetical protein